MQLKEQKIIYILLKFGYNKNMLNVIVAPKSYCTRAESLAKRVAGYLKSKQVEYSVYFSLDIDDLKQNTDYLLSLGENEFVLIGDDRVLNIMVNNVKDLSKIKLGIIPVSSHDDFASYLGISSNPILAIKSILKRRVENIDLLVCNGMRVVNNVIIGATVDVYESYNTYKWKNAITEKYASVKYGSKYTPKNLKIDVKNSKTRHESIFELIIANGGFSNGKKLSPLSNAKDGLFNLLYVTEENRKMFNRSIRSIFSGKHIYLENTVQLWGSEAHITAEDQNIKCMLDGEVHNLERIDISLMEGALKIYK